LVSPFIGSIDALQPRRGQRSVSKPSKYGPNSLTGAVLKVFQAPGSRVKLAFGDFAMWSFPPFRLDPLAQRLLRGDERLSIKPRAFAVLRYLVERPERLITKQELLEALWPGVHVDSGVLKTHVHEIRQILGDQAKPARFIETVTGYGYRFVGGVQERLGPPAAQRQRSEGAGDLLVGREGERECLERALGRALQGERRVVFVTGEAGIGKTALVNRFLSALMNHPGVAVGWGQCVEQYGAGEAYLPILEALSRLARRSDGGQLVRTLQRHAPSWLAQMPELIDGAGGPAPERGAATATRERMLRELAQTLPVVGERCPLILLIEDLHWADPSTLTLISYLARQSDRARLLILGTFRPHEVRLTPHPLGEIEQSLAQQERCEEIALRHLDQPDIARFLDARFQPHRLPAELGQRLRSHTSGNPLFLTRVVDAMVKSGHLREAGGYWQLDAEIHAATRDVPPSIGALIEREVMRLSDFDRDVLEVASVAGTEFWVAAVASALELDLVLVEQVCLRWSRSGRFLREQHAGEANRGERGLHCAFIHSLFQQVILERIPPARRAQLHARIGAWLEATHAENLRSVAAELSMHFERTADAARAISYRQLAGEQALARCAYQEAIQHLHAAQALLGSLPDGSGRQRVELVLLCALGIPVAMTQGYASPEVEQGYLRARELSRELGDASRLLRALIGLSVCYAVRGQFVLARELADQADGLAQAEPPHAAIRLEANLSRLFARFHLGEFETAREQVARAIELHGVTDNNSAALSIHQDLDTALSFVISWPLWSLGHPDQARYWAEHGVELATKRGDHFAVAQCLAYLVVVHVFRGELELVEARAEACKSLCIEHGFRLFHTSAMMALGSVLVERGDAATGIALMLQGWEHRLPLKAMVNAGFWCSLIANAYARAGRYEEALDMLDQAFALTRERGERWWEPELHRLFGEFHGRASQSGDVRVVQIYAARGTSEAAVSRALELAREMGAKSLELRAATTLSRIWNGQGKSDAARQLVTLVYDSFTEGHDTRDLREAREQLDTFAARSKVLGRGGEPNERSRPI
jgi:DNA-binding winged helix-turn-helix (wHTH) protein/tetratricopeptide (TPR) repeat protein